MAALEEQLIALFDERVLPGSPWNEIDREWFTSILRTAAAIGDSAGYARGRAEAFERAAKAVAAVDGWSRMTQDACVDAIRALDAAERKEKHVKGCECDQCCDCWTCVNERVAAQGKEQP